MYIYKNLSMSRKYYKIVVFVMAVFCFNNSYSQNNVNNYKYVIVPTTFDFLNEPDEYRLNSLSEFLFNKYGFTAIMQGDDIPNDLQENGCLALRADVVKDKGIFLTKLHVELKNCRDEIVFSGANGESKEKKYVVAYNDALREAFLYVKELNYKYEPIKTIENDKTPTITEVTEPKKAADASAINTTVMASVEKADDADSELLYAQPINNGYQLVDSTPKVVYTLIFTGKKDFYMVKGRDATVYKLEDKWVIAETIGDDLQVKTLNIKF